MVARSSLLLCVRNHIFKIKFDHVTSKALNGSPSQQDVALSPRSCSQGSLQGAKTPLTVTWALSASPLQGLEQTKSQERGTEPRVEAHISPPGPAHTPGIEYPHPHSQPPPRNATLWGTEEWGSLCWGQIRWQYFAEGGCPPLILLSLKFQRGLLKKYKN